MAKNRFFTTIFLMVSVFMISAFGVMAAEKPKFDVNDILIPGIHMGMTMEEVKVTLGNPTSITTNEDDGEGGELFFYGDYVDYHYGNTILRFYALDAYDLVLESINIEDASIMLPNGLRVGDTASKVMNTYYNDGQGRKAVSYGEEFATFLYGSYLFDYDNKPTTFLQTALCHYPSEYDGEYLIEYQCYVPDETLFEGYKEVSLIFYIDKFDKVKSILLTEDSF